MLEYNTVQSVLYTGLCAHIKMILRSTGGICKRPACLPCRTSTIATSLELWKQHTSGGSLKAQCVRAFRLCTPVCTVLILANGWKWKSSRGQALAVASIQTSCALATRCQFRVDQFAEKAPKIHEFVVLLKLSITSINGHRFSFLLYKLI